MLQISLLSCEQKNTNDMNIKNIELFQESIEYPYIASEKRKIAILENMNKLEKGMTKGQVIELMTQPDEANSTYKFKKATSDNVIGFSLVYILKRDVESGGVLEKDEHLIRIHFDNFEKLLWAYAEMIDEFKTIEKEKE